MVPIRVGPVHGAEVSERILSLYLHNVHLAAGGPSDAADVGAEGPERRPYPLPLRRFDSGFDPGVDAERLVSAGIHTGRRVGTPAEVLAARFDDQHSVYDARVLRAVGVVFQLVVTKAAVAEIKVPVRGVDRRPVEFIGP